MPGPQIGANPAASATSLTDGKGFAVGDTYTDHDGKEYVFVQASSAIAQYDAVWVKAAHESIPVTLAASQGPGKFGVAPVAIALDSYGWVQTEGACIVSVLASCAADVTLFTSGTAGALNDATLSVSQNIVNGIVLLSAEAASVANAYMSNVTITRLISA